MSGVEAEGPRAELAATWPQLGLRITHGELVLAPPTDDELRELAAIVGRPGGIVGQGQAHFVTWPTGDAAAVDAFWRFHRALRVRPDPQRWLVPFAVLDRGRPVGVVALDADRFTADRTVGTRAWFARAEQGRGLGRRTRLMLLELAFAHLGAWRATTVATADNAASRRVTEGLGYEETDRVPLDDGVVEVHYALTADAWRPRRLPDVRVEGVAAFLAALRP